MNVGGVVHTLNHYNLFGASYLSACRHNLDVVASL